MKRIHFSDKYLLSPQHPVTVCVIGAGGTGSQVLSNLARIDVTLRALNHPGLFVTVYDPDEVSAANIGRQLFGGADLGLNKGVCLVTRINRFFGCDWRAEPRPYPTDVKNGDLHNITITCTDNAASRIELWENLKKYRNTKHTDHATPLYWMDFGNSPASGQVILGNVRKHIKQPRSEKFKAVETLLNVTELFDLSTVKDEDSGPSCSLAEALEKQDLFINSTLAQLGCGLIWKLFRNGNIEHHGLYLNLDTMKVNPIAV